MNVSELELTSFPLRADLRCSIECGGSRIWRQDPRRPVDLWVRYIALRIPVHDLDRWKL